MEQRRHNKTPPAETVAMKEKGFWKDSSRKWRTIHVFPQELWHLVDIEVNKTPGNNQGKRMDP